MIVQEANTDIFYSSDIEIAKSHMPKDISQLAKEVNIYPKELILYGDKKAKVSLNLLDRLKEKPNGNYVVVTG